MIESTEKQRDLVAHTALVPRGAVRIARALALNGRARR